MNFITENLDALVIAMIGVIFAELALWKMPAGARKFGFTLLIAIPLVTIFLVIWNIVRHFI